MNRAITKQRRMKRNRKRKLERLNPQTIYDAYSVDLPLAYIPSIKGSRAIRAALRQSFDQVFLEQGRRGKKKQSELIPDIDYKDICSEPAVDYECCGGAFLSLCRSRKLNRLCNLGKHVNRILILTAVRLGLSATVLKQSLSSGISLFGVICSNIPPLGLALLNEPKDSILYPNPRQHGSPGNYDTSRTLFYNMYRNGSFTCIALFKLWCGLMTIHELCECIDFDFNWSHYDSDMHNMDSCLYNTILEILASDAIHHETGLLIQNSHRVNEICWRHADYKKDMQVVLPETLRSINIPSCLHSLIESYVFVRGVAKRTAKRTQKEHRLLLPIL